VAAGTAVRDRDGGGESVPIATSSHLITPHTNTLPATRQCTKRKASAETSELAYTLGEGNRRLVARAVAGTIHSVGRKAAYTQ
jgi:hypothetical protein